jgi:hypothetical protein
MTIRRFLPVMMLSGMLIQGCGESQRMQPTGKLVGQYCVPATLNSLVWINFTHSLVLADQGEAGPLIAPGVRAHVIPGHTVVMLDSFADHDGFPLRHPVAFFPALSSFSYRIAIEAKASMSPWHMAVAASAKAEKIAPCHWSYGVTVVGAQQVKRLITPFAGPGLPEDLVSMSLRGDRADSYASIMALARTLAGRYALPLGNPDRRVELVGWRDAVGQLHEDGQGFLSAIGRIMQDQLAGSAGISQKAAGVHVIVRAIDDGGGTAAYDELDLATVCFLAGGVDLIMHDQEVAWQWQGICETPVFSAGVPASAGVELLHPGMESHLAYDIAVIASADADDEGGATTLRDTKDVLMGILSVAIQSLIEDAISDGHHRDTGTAQSESKGKNKSQPKGTEAGSKQHGK